MSPILSCGGRWREYGGFSKMASFGNALKEWCFKSNCGDGVGVRGVEKSEDMQYTVLTSLQATILGIDLTKPQDSKARDKTFQFDGSILHASKQLKQLKQMHLANAFGLNCILETDANVNAFVQKKNNDVKTSKYDDITLLNMDKQGFRPIEPVTVFSQLPRPQVIKPKPLQYAVNKTVDYSPQLQKTVVLKPHAFKPVRASSRDLECNAVSEMGFRPIEPVKVASKNLSHKVVRPIPVKVTASEHVVIKPKVVKPTILKPHVFKRAPAKSECSKVKSVSETAFRPVEPMKVTAQHSMPQIIKPKAIKPAVLQTEGITSPVKPHTIGKTIVMEPVQFKPQAFRPYVRQNN